VPQEHERWQPKLVASAEPGQAAVPPLVEAVLSAPGQPLDTAARDFMEPRFGHDFSRVRVHTDELAARSAEAVAAKAYTVGPHVVFGMGRHAPATRDGQRLLAHELVHVLQQSASGPAPGWVLARQSAPTKPPAAPAKSPAAPAKPPAAPAKPPFHPGVMHNHKPSGKWAEVQDNPDSGFLENRVCAHSTPEEVIELAAFAELQGKWIALDHPRWYFYKGSGADFVENSNLELMLRHDSGIQAVLNNVIPTNRKSGTFTHHLKIEQPDYDDQDFRFAFGAIDQLDFEVDFDAGTIHAWFQDRYEWHPVYPFYSHFSDDDHRDTNCVHAAAVELKSGTARDYWMIGEATIQLQALQSTPERQTLQSPLLPLWTGIFSL
jgi:hypothetical protein